MWLNHYRTQHAHFQLERVIFIQIISHLRNSFIWAVALAEGMVHRNGET